MKKENMRAIAEKYDMEILRNPITREAWGLYLKTDREIPELDKIVANSNDHYYSHGFNAIFAERWYSFGDVVYRIACPKRWFDLYGWVD